MTPEDQIRPGYIRTEVGVIPEDWVATKLGAIKTLMTNGFVGTATRHYERNENGVLYIQGYNVEENSFNFRGIKHVTEEFHKLHMKSCLRTDDLLTIQTGDVGLTTVVPKSLSGANCHALIITRLNSRYAHSKFVSYYLNSDKGRARLRLIETGTTMKHLNVGDMLHFLVPIPPLPEQRAIAAALSDADGLIAALEALIAKKRDLKQAAMQQLLTGKTRLPGFSGEWEVKRLGDLAAIRNDKINTLDAEVAAFCVELEQIGQSTGQIDGHSDARSRRSVKYHFRQGDVLFGRLRPYLRKFWWANRDGVCSTEIWPLVPIDNRLVSGFLFQTVMTDEFIEAANSSYGTHMPRSDWKALRQFELLVPIDSQEQTAISEVLSDMDADLAALEAQRDKAKEIKQGMMQEQGYLLKAKKLLQIIWVSESLI